MQYRTADNRPPLQRMPARSFVTEALAWGAVIALPFVIWCAL